MTKEQWQIFKKRNIKIYAQNKIFGVHRLKQAMGRAEQMSLALNLSLKMAQKFIQFLSCFLPFVAWRKAFRHYFMKFFQFSLVDIECFKKIVAFKLFGKIVLPQVEFAVTTRCNLRCKHCTNYIPYLSNEAQKVLDFKHFKMYLNHLLANVSRLNSLLLLGGEPLLNKELPQMLEYSLNCAKIENVYLTTNGTIAFNDELKELFCKHKNKLWVWISNYTANEKLVKRLKSFELLDFCKANQINYIFIENNIWGKSLAPKYYERSDEENSSYFLKCNNPCVSVYGNELSVCPRASHFSAMKMISQGGGEHLLLNQTISKAELISFYTFTNFSACRYCDVLNENESVIPALQLNE